MASFVLHCHFVSFPFPFRVPPLPCCPSCPCCLVVLRQKYYHYLQCCKMQTTAARCGGHARLCRRLCKLRHKVANENCWLATHTHTHRPTHTLCHTAVATECATVRPEPAVRYEGCSHWKVFLAFNCAGKMKMEWKMEMEMLCGCPALPCPAQPYNMLCYTAVLLTSALPIYLPHKVYLGNASKKPKCLTFSLYFFSNFFYYFIFLLNLHLSNLQVCNCHDLLARQTKILLISFRKYFS